MATTTPKLALVKPDPTENVDITVINANMDKIDTGFSSIAPSYRNVIRNGDFSIAQRGDGPFTTGGYCLDGMTKANTGGTVTVQKWPLSSGVPGGRFYISCTTTGQSAAADYTILNFMIENGQMLLGGKTVTLSFLAGMGSGTSKIGVELTSNFGTGGSPTSTFQTAISAIPILVTSATSTLGRYSVTFTVPTNVGKTFGTNNNDVLQLTLWLSAGTSFNTRSSSIGIQNVGVNLTDVQLEEGSVATAFERLPQQVQLAWCQRYYWRQVYDAGKGVGIGAVYTASQHVVYLALPVPMRIAPTFASSAVGGTNWLTWGNAQNSGLTSMTFTAVTERGCEISLAPSNTSSGILTGGAVFFRANVAGMWLEASAEL